MKLKTLTAAILLTLSASNFAETIDVQNDELEVFVENENGVVTKKVIRNGQELTQDEIQELEESGDLKILRLDGNMHKMHDDGFNKMIVIDTSDEDFETKGDYKIIKKYINSTHSTKMDVDVEFSEGVERDIKTITINGNELSDEDIEQMKADGDLKIIKLDEDDIDGLDGHKVIVAKSGEDLKFDMMNVKVLTEDISSEGDNTFMTRKVIVSSQDDPNRGRLGFIATAKDDGWHVTSVMDESGAKDAGIMNGDLITKIGDQSLVDSKGIKLDKHDVGDYVPIQLTRNGEQMYLNVEAKKAEDISLSEILIQSGVNMNNSAKDGLNFSGDREIVFINKDNNFAFDKDDINIRFPDSLKDMNIFISDGRSTSKLLGKNHKLSSMSKDLAKYFGTNDGVLVLNVDSGNVFGLKDGDVIQSIDGINVNSPKSVIKQLLKSEEQDKLAMKITRNKKSKTLKAKL